MNFLPKKRTHFRGLAENPKQEPDPSFERMRRKYVLFCESVIISPEQSARDFLTLCSLEETDKVNIVDNDGYTCLIVGTKGVVLMDSKTSRFHDVGKMLIVMRRKPNTELYFYNQTRIVEAEHSGGRSSFHHPHVNDVGRICSSYYDIILQELAGGKVLSAMEKALQAIHTYGPDRPLRDISYWPIAEFMEGDQNA